MRHIKTASPKGRCFFSVLPSSGFGIFLKPIKTRKGREFAEVVGVGGGGGHPFRRYLDLGDGAAAYGDADGGGRCGGVVLKGDDVVAVAVRDLLDRGGSVIVVVKRPAQRFDGGEAAALDRKSVV